MSTEYRFGAFVCDTFYRVIRPAVHETLGVMVGASGAGYTRYALTVDVVRETGSWVNKQRPK